jgi:MFS family permease
VSDSIKLLSSRRFGPFFLTQLLGAFNDNLYKNGLTIFVAFQAAAVSQQQSNTLVNVAAGLFILPFFLFSPIAGQLADKYEKAMLIQRIKLLEIGIMLLGACAFLLQSPVLLIAMLFLMGTQSTLFGPVKYSLLPQALKPGELVGGNAMVEFGTFVAILAGLIAGSFFISQGVATMALAVVITACVGYWASRAIPPMAPAAPDLKISFDILRQGLSIMHDARANQSVFYSVMGISWFWFIGLRTGRKRKCVRFTAGHVFPGHWRWLVFMRTPFRTHGRNRPGPDRRARSYPVRYRSLFQPGPVRAPAVDRAGRIHGARLESACVL